jgi:hypothetical protein
MAQETGLMISRFGRPLTLLVAVAAAVVFSGCGLFGPRHMSSGELAGELGLGESAVSKDFYTNTFIIQGRGHKLVTAPGAEFFVIDGAPVHLDERIHMRGAHPAWPREALKTARPVFQSPGS